MQWPDDCDNSGNLAYMYIT